MSAYGTIQPPAKPQVLLSPTIYLISRKTHTRSPSYVKVEPQADLGWTHIAVFHLTSRDAPPELIDVLYEEFAEELERDEARTYPQEKGMTKEEFVAYYFARDVFVGLGLAIDPGKTPYDSSRTLEDARAGRDWKSAVAGFYYIKPNYPGHSSHLCNAGFVIPHTRRGQGLGNILARSFLHYAPALGYRGSVFNLVYVDNPASIKIWDTLGFQKVGLIPGAGKRVRKAADSQKEEVYYVDAHVVYKSFD